MKKIQLFTIFIIMNDNAVIVQNIKPLRPAHKQTSITRKKFLDILSYLGEEFNISKACYKAGIHRDTFYKAINTNETFSKAFQDVKDAYLDQVESAGFSVAIQADARSFNDRKLMLQAHRPEIYNPVQKTEVNFTIREENATIEARKILSNLAVENVEYKVIDK